MAEMLSENWATLWEALATAQPDHTAVVIGDRRMSWSQLDERAARLATVLDTAGIGHDHKVGQLLHNCPEYLESAYASFKVRASTVNVNYRYKAPEIVDRHMAEGRNGLRDGAGFYDWSGIDAGEYRQKRLGAFVSLLKALDLAPKGQMP